MSQRSAAPDENRTSPTDEAQVVHVHGQAVYGVEVGPETRCAHYHGDTDVIAIRFACCDRFYPCHACHEAAADHPAEVWPVSAFDTPAVLCGGCGHVLTVREYLNSNSVCTHCGVAFNPGCARHRHLYFATPGDGQKSPPEG